MTREKSLDGLRGVAALVVVLGHSLMTIPALSGTLRGESHADGWAWWLTNTPLHALWDGSDAVFVFFVLSGFVLVSGRQRTRDDWVAYYPSRLVRLYLPVAAAVLLAVVLTRTVYAWQATSLHSVARDIALVRGVDLLDPPLWSLQWEVYFSLLLPVYVLFAYAWPRWWPVKVGVCLLVVTVGFHRADLALICLPIFALGSVLAAEHRRGTVQGWLEGLGPRGAGRLTKVLALTALLTYCARDLLAAPAEPGHGLAVLAGTFESAGALLVVMLAVYAEPVRRVLNRRLPQWLGSRSFSLYLVHAPVLVVVVHVVGGAGSGAAAVLTVPLALLVAEVFYRLLERPAHRVSRQVSRRLSADSGSRPRDKPGNARRTAELLG